MKNCRFSILLAVLALATVAASRVTPQNNCEGEIDQITEKIYVPRDLSLKNKVDSGLDPLIIPAINNIKRKDYDFSLSEATITGLGNILVKNLTRIDDSAIWIDFSVPQLDIQADHYRLLVKGFWFFNIIDDVGKFRCDVSNLRVWGNAYLGTDGDQTVISHMHVQYSFEHVKVVLTGSRPRVNEKVNGELRSIMNDKEVERSVSLFIKDKARSYFRGYTPEEIMDAISTTEEH